MLWDFEYILWMDFLKLLLLLAYAVACYTFFSDCYFLEVICMNCNIKW